jgi:flagellar biosynthetic protein FliP
MSAFHRLRSALRVPRCTFLLLLCSLSLTFAVEPPPLQTPAGQVTSASIESTQTTIPAATSQVLNLPAAPGQPGLVISFNPGEKGGKALSSPVVLLLAITALSVAPAFLMMMTSFTRIIIVLGFLRRALGTQTLPPNQVMAGLALFLTMFVMAPTFTRINRDAVQPYLAEQITQEAAVTTAKDAVKAFMLAQTRKNDLALFIRLAKEERPATAADVSFTTLVPAFITSELKTAFQMGFVIFLPFLVIDLVVSAVLMALGMMMLPPVVVSLPFKVLLFCLVDGWTLLMQALVASYAVPLATGAGG